MNKQLAVTVRVMNPVGGFNTDPLNELLAQGYKVNGAYASSDNSLLVILDEPTDEKQSSREGP